MIFLPEALRRQNELVRALRKELAAKERELANQKWVFEQFLRSPSWRFTAPFRWTVNQFRKLNSGPLSSDVPNENTTEPELPPQSIELTSEVKAAFTSLCQISLVSFLSSTATLTLRDSPRPEISVILVLFNRAELTLACLRSIIENGRDLEVVIVDNASTDDTARLLDRLKGARIIRNSENRNFLLAVNQAARECRGDYILLLNNDAQLLPGALENVLSTMKNSPDIGAVGGKVILLDGTLQEAGDIVWKDGSCLGYGRGDNPFAAPYMFRRDVDYCSGAFLLTPRKIWEQLRGFDEAFKPAYYEETDYCMRLWQLGLRVVYEPAAAIIHFEFGSSSTVSSATELQARNQRIFAERHPSELAVHEAPHPDRLIRARARHRGRKVLFLDDRVPHLWLGSGFPRAHSLLRALLKQGCFVTIYPLAGIMEPWDMVYSDLPREVEVMIGLDRSMLESFLRNREHYYETIIVSRPHNMELIAPLLEAHRDWFADTAIIYDAEAIFAFRDKGLAELSGKPLAAEELQTALAAEVRLAKAADSVIAVSESERQTFLSYGIERAEVLGHSIQPAATATPFKQRSGLLFVGAIHEEISPNSDSLVWFLQDILPRIQAVLSAVHLTVAGVNKSERVRSLAGDLVEIKGHVPDLTPLYSESRLLIAPTRYAAGIPHKVHEAAAHGLPVVATGLLAAQLAWTGAEIAIGDSAAEFAAQCIEVYTNERKWTAFRNGALERVAAECSPRAFEEKVGKILQGGKANVGSSLSKLSSF